MNVQEIVNEKDIKQLIKKDEIFNFIHKTFGTPPNWSRPQGFESLSKIILEQQISLASANAHFLKLNSYLPQFTPAEVLKLTDEEMRLCQISRQKTKYLRALASAIQNGDVDFEKMSQSNLSIRRQQLTSIKGIGEWTADIYLMFCMQEKDIFPIGDIAVVNTVRALELATNKEEIIALAGKWKPFRSLAAYFFWHYYLKKRNRTAP